MTAIDGSKATKVRREVPGSRGERLVITLAPEGAWVRPKGKRIAYLMPYGLMLRQAAEAFGMAEKRRKQQERKQRRATTH